MIEKQGRLLVVDDDRAIRKLLERIAKRAGFEVDSAKDGLEALEMLDRNDYDVALIDLMMPRLSGYELVQQISTRERRPIVIVATALANSDVAAIDDSIVRRVIRKPFDVHAVATALVEAVQTLAVKRVTADAAATATLPIADPSPKKAGDEKAAEPNAEAAAATLPIAETSPKKAVDEKPAEPGSEAPVILPKPC